MAIYRLPPIPAQYTKGIAPFVTGPVTVEGTATLTASGTGAAAGIVTVLAAATLTASGTGTANGTVTVFAAAMLTASGTGTANGIVTVLAAATLTATGTGTTAGIATVLAAATLTATGTGAATGTVTVFGAATLTASGTGAAVGNVLVTVTGAATLTATGAGTAVSVEAAQGGGLVFRVFVAPRRPAPIIASAALELPSFEAQGRGIVGVLARGAWDLPRIAGAGFGRIDNSINEQIAEEDEIILALFGG